MPITAEQKIERRKHIGSSDMAAILGLDPWRSAYDVWLDKKGMLVDAPETDAMYAGNRFEAGVLEFAEEQLGALLRNETRAVEGTPLVSNIDAVVEKSDDPVEGKTVGLFHPSSEWWGDDGTDQVPDRVIVQSHVHIMATNRAVCHVPAFIGGRGFCMFEVPRNDKLVEIIGQRAVEFWDANVQGDVPPENSRASLQVVKLVRRQPKKVVSIDPELVAKWLEAKDALKESTEAKQQAEADVLAAMGDAEAGLCGERGAVTYYETTRKAYSVDETTFRTLRHKKKGL